MLRVPCIRRPRLGVLYSGKEREISESGAAPANRRTDRALPHGADQEKKSGSHEEGLEETTIVMACNSAAGDRQIDTKRAGSLCLRNSSWDPLAPPPI